MLAIIEAGGKQYLVSRGDKIQVEKMSGEAGSEIVFDKVLFTGTDSDFVVGKPFIEKTTVTGKVLKQGRSKKVEILKYKAKSKYRKKQGHRQSYTEVEITKV